MISKTVDRGNPERSDLWTRSAFVALPLLLMTAAFILVKTGRDALYFQDDGLFDLPAAYIGIAVMAPGMAVMILALMRRLGTRGVRVVAPLATAGIIAAFSVVASPGGGPLMTGFFMFIPLAFGVLFSLSWLLGADLLDKVSEKLRARPYAIFGSASIVGGVLGGMAARVLAEFVEPALLILIGATTLAISALVMWQAHRRFPLNMTAMPRHGSSPQQEAIGTVVRQPYVMTLLGIAIMGSLTGVLVEFQFYAAAATSGSGSSEQLVFFANLYVALNVGALTLQLLLVPVLQRWIGVMGGLLLLPLAMVGGASVLLGSSSLLLSSGLRATEGGLKSSIHRSNWEQTFVSMSRTTRTVAKLIIDGTGARFGEGLAAVIMLIWLSGVSRSDLAGLDTSSLMRLLLAVAILWLLLVWKLRHSRVLKKREGLLRNADVRIPVPDG